MGQELSLPNDDYYYDDYGSAGPLARGRGGRGGKKQKQREQKVQAAKEAMMLQGRG